MRKNSARLVLLAATAALAIAPVSASARPSSKPGEQVTRTQSGDNVGQRDIQSGRSIDDRYDRFNIFGNFNRFLSFLSIGAGT